MSGFRTGRRFDGFLTAVDIFYNSRLLGQQG